MATKIKDRHSVKMNGVTLSYGRVGSGSASGIPVLEDITLSVAPDELLAIIGPNGSGKTTILKALLGLLTPVSGTIEVLGRAPKEGRKDVGYLPQKRRFDPAFPINVFDAVLMGRYRGLFKGYTAGDREKTKAVLERVGMYGRRGSQVGTLSGGEAQRVFLARAIVKEPKLLLLDEPTASIDPEMQSSFYDLLSELKKRMAILLVTHDIGAISVHVDTVACVNRTLFYHGSAEGIENLDELYSCPVDIISHGVPHRVLADHAKEHGGVNDKAHDRGRDCCGHDTPERSDGHGTPERSDGHGTPERQDGDRDV